MTRRLRMSVSVFFTALTVLLCVLWERSFFVTDICGVTFEGTRRWNFASMDGRIFLILPTYKSALWAIGKHREWDIRSGGEYSNSQFDDYQVLYLKHFDDYCRVIVPYWLLAMFSAAFAAAPWMMWRFSLRTLLIVVTLVAVLLGMGIWLNSFLTG